MLVGFDLGGGSYVGNDDYTSSSSAPAVALRIGHSVSEKVAVSGVIGAYLDDFVVSRLQAELTLFPMVARTSKLDVYFRAGFGIGNLHNDGTLIGIIGSGGIGVGYPLSKTFSAGIGLEILGGKYKADSGYDNSYGYTLRQGYLQFLWH